MFLLIKSALTRGTMCFKNIQRYCSTNTKLNFEPLMRFPNSDERFSRYLDSLVEIKINSSNKKPSILRTIREQYENRKAIIAQLIELQESMVNENNEEMIQMGVEEVTVFLLIAYVFICQN